MSRDSAFSSPRAAESTAQIPRETPDAKTRPAPRRGPRRAASRPRTAPNLPPPSGYISLARPIPPGSPRARRAPESYNYRAPNRPNPLPTAQTTTAATGPRPPPPVRRLPKSFPEAALRQTPALPSAPTRAIARRRIRYPPATGTPPSAAPATDHAPHHPQRTPPSTGPRPRETPGMPSSGAPSSLPAGPPLHSSALRCETAPNARMVRGSRSYHQSPIRSHPAPARRAATA